MNAGFIVEQMSDGHRNGFIGAIEDIFFLCRLRIAGFMVFW